MACINIATKKLTFFPIYDSNKEHEWCWDQEF